MKNFLSHDNNNSALIIGILVITSLILCSDLISPFMPSSIVMLAIGLFIAAFALFAVLVWREQPRDERETQIVLAADRLGFLAGAIFLSIAVVVQTIRHEHPTLLIVALMVMILAKLLGKYIVK